MKKENLIKASFLGENFKVKLQNEIHTIYADEPESIGGKNMGLSPFEILSSSLAACTTITLKMYMDRKKWLIDELIVEISLETFTENETLKANFIRNITINGSTIGEGEKTRLLQIAQACPVSKILKSSENKILSFIN